MIKTTQQAEIERVQALMEQRKLKPSYEFLKTTSLVEAVRAAKEQGWKEKKVQVRGNNIAGDVVEYTIEPYEEDCGCPSLLRYKDFFM